MTIGELSRIWMEYDETQQSPIKKSFFLSFSLIFWLEMSVSINGALLSLSVNNLTVALMSTTFSSIFLTFVNIFLYFISSCFIIHDIMKKKKEICSKIKLLPPWYRYRPNSTETKNIIVNFFFYYYWGHQKMENLVMAILQP